MQCITGWPLAWERKSHSLYRVRYKTFNSWHGISRCNSEKGTSHLEHASWMPALGVTCTVALMCISQSRITWECQCSGKAKGLQNFQQVGQCFCYCLIRKSQTEEKNRIKVMLAITLVFVQGNAFTYYETIFIINFWMKVMWDNVWSKNSFLVHHYGLMILVILQLTHFQTWSD